ncbi:MAG: mechanosensitive ion channel [Puniceicoccales bacterium]|nr:mechanosensitive ion channel [Puniceicoccales bacterium]
MRVVEKMLERTRFDVTLRRFFCRALQSFLFAVVVLVVFDIFGVQTTSFIALLGAIGLALGLAVQGALSNFAAGVMLIILRPFKVEDAIEVGSIAGIVEEIGIFSARLRTADNRVIIVPNATFMAQPVTNATANPLRRVDLLIGVGYGDNLDTVKRIISGVLKKDTRVLETPVAAVLVDSLGESAVNIAVRSWVNTRDYAAVRADLLEKIKGALEAGGCTIPYPQCDVHLAGGASHATSPSVVP